MSLDYVVSKMSDLDTHGFPWLMNALLFVEKGAAFIWRV